MKEEGIDSMKYRTSTHLAGVDVERIIAEKGKCLLVIKQSYYDTNVNVSGNKTDGYFIEFDNQKPMKVNSGNRKQIAKIYKDLHKCTSTESRNIANWVGLEIELYFDENVKMMGKITGGTRVKYQLPTNKTDDKGALSMLGMCNSLESLKVTWLALTDSEKTLPTVLAKKELMKNKLK